MRGLDAVKLRNVPVRHWRRDPLPCVIRPNSFLATRHAQQVLVDGTVPVPIETAAGEGCIESLPMQLFSFGQGAVDIEDQRGGAPDQLGRAGWRYDRFRLHDRRLPDDAPVTSDHRPGWRASKIAISFAGPKNLL